MKNRTIGLATLALLASFISATPSGAQSVRVEGDVNHPANRVLSDILTRNQYLVIERDTVLGADFVTDGDLLVIRSDVRLAGRVGGSVAVIQGAFFTRPGSRIEGELASIGGELYLSRLAEVGAVHELPTGVGTGVAYEAGTHTVTLVPPSLPARVGTTGIFGLAVPTYDRVNGLTARWGSQLLLRRDTVPPVIRGSVSYATARRAVGGSIALDVPVAGGWVTAEVAREAFTNEAWIRGPLMNTLSTLILRSDVRDYHESDVALLRFERRQRQPIIQGESFWGPRLTVRGSRDRSLEAANVWSLTGRDEPWRENPPISDGEIFSVSPGALVEWRGAVSWFRGDVSVEWAPGGVGDFEFVHLVSEGRLTMPALWNHSLELRGRTHQTLGGSAAPAQRWTLFGGGGTVPTLPVAAMRGDRLVFLETKYDIPLAWVRLPLVGSPDLRLQHATGAAWVTNTPMPDLEQSIGAGLRFFLIQALVHVDPAARPLRPIYSIGTGFQF
ncbi:MAG: hypothetical protein H0U67_12880 [Gemmatimonadetes bacterium]|nr:hypothetical protein [Gemmatimonadota bacterium]